MSQITQAFQPPLYWQQFEDLTAAVFTYIYGDPKPQKFGRPGQAQNGVDVVGKSTRTNYLVGIQCKRMDELDDNNNPYPGGAITEKLLRAEYNKALKFKPQLGEWILATTAKRDAKVQRAALILDEESRSNDQSGIGVWFWDDFVTDLNRYGKLQRDYYGSVINVQNSADQDHLILDLYAHAFSRPAFQDALWDEDADEFIQAIKDTLRAMNIGELLDRETRHIIRRTIGGRRAIQDRAWREKCDTIYTTLQDLKKRFNDGLKAGQIQQVGRNLQIQAPLLTDLTALRSKCLAELNSLLKAAGLPAV